MLEKVFKIWQVSAVELNLACPNIPDKPTVAYDFEQIETVLDAVSNLPLFGEKPFGVKLAPYFDLLHIKKVVQIISL